LRGDLFLVHRQGCRRDLTNKVKYSNILVIIWIIFQGEVSYLSRTVHYYNVYLTKNGKKTDLYFTDFLDKVRLIDWQDRIRMINNAPIALFALKVPQNSINRIFAVGKYRQDIKPYVGDIQFEKADLIRQDIIEMVTAGVIPQSRTVALEYNMYGSKVRDLQEYFNSFFPEGTERWRVEFEPIDSERSLRDVQESNDIRRVEIKLNVHDGLLNRFAEPCQSNEQPRSLFAAIVASAGVVNDSLDASVVSLAFGSGRKKDEIMNVSEVIKLVEIMDLEIDVIQSLKVRYRNAKTGRIEDLDLKYAGILKDTIDINDPEIGWEFLGDRILENYFNKNSPGSTAYAKRGYSFSPVIFPTLNSIPNEKYRVQVEKGDRAEN